MSPFGIDGALAGKPKKGSKLPKFLVKHFADMFMEKSFDLTTGTTKLLKSEDCYSVAINSLSC